MTLAWEDRDDPQAHRVVWWGTKWCDLAEGGSSGHIQQQVRGTGVVSDLGQGVTKAWGSGEENLFVIHTTFSSSSPKTPIYFSSFLL